jgi:hemoglobin
MRHEGITEDSLRDLVALFYHRIRADTFIGPLFNKAIRDWPEHLDKLQAFWSSVMLTSGRYKGRPLPAHIAHADKIDSRAFARWLAMWKEATEDVLDPQSAAALQKKASRIAESLSLGIQFSQHPRRAVAQPVELAS